MRTYLHLKRWLPVGIIVIAWTMFVASFFLPATGGVVSVAGTAPGAPLNGWQAFKVSILAGAMNPWVWIVEPRVLLCLLFPLANLFLFVFPALVSFAPERSGVFAVPLAALAGLPWLLPNSLTGELFIGFYCWNASFALMALGCLLIPWHYSFQPSLIEPE